MFSAFSPPRAWFTALVIALSASLQAAELRLPRIFTDNMVLQQELPVAVWGWAEAGEDIAVTFNGKTVTTATGGSGRWMERVDSRRSRGRQAGTCPRKARAAQGLHRGRPRVRSAYSRGTQGPGGAHHVGKGLKAGNDQPLNWFEISDGTDENRRLKYVKATARIIDADTVEVSSPEIAEPKFVRFGWHSLARYNLVNSDDLPAISFKTDPQDHHRR